MDRRTALRKTAMLAGTAVATPGLFSLLQSCQQQPRLNWQPAILSQEQAGLISSLVDTLLPETKTPGGLDMKVDIFIDAAIYQLFDKAGQKTIKSEIDAFDAECKKKHGDYFALLDEEDRSKFLKEKERESPKYNGKVWGTAVGVQQAVGFYRSMKSMILWGYFSSEEIGKNVLSYDPIPGHYRGCIPLSDVDNSWSL